MELLVGVSLIFYILYVYSRFKLAWIARKALLFTHDHIHEHGSQKSMAKYNAILSKYLKNGNFKKINSKIIIELKNELVELLTDNTYTDNTYSDNRNANSAKSDDKNNTSYYDLDINTLDARHKATLGLSAGAPISEIKTQYKELIQKYHPDKVNQWKRV